MAYEVDVPPLQGNEFAASQARVGGKADSFGILSIIGLAGRTLFLGDVGVEVRVAMLTFL